MLTRWLISHHVRGVAWRSPQGSWTDWRAGPHHREYEAIASNDPGNQRHRGNQDTNVHY
jgi:hypothetical protein